MPQLQAAIFEPGCRSVRGSPGISVFIAEVFKPRIRKHFGCHMLGIILPVGCDMQTGAWLEQASQQIAKSLVDYPSLVVSFLVPGVGEEQEYAVERLRG